MSIYGEGLGRCATHGPVSPATRPVEQLARREWESTCPECGELALGADSGREPGLARLRIPVLAFAVDRHRRGDQQLADPFTALDRLLQQHRRADRVDRCVALDLVHRLAHADGGSEVHDGVDTVERTPDSFMVADVSDLQLDLAVEVIGPAADGMNLGIEVVEGSDLVPLGQKPVGEVRADEAGAAGDENAHDRGAGYLSSGALGLATPRRFSTARITAPGKERAIVTTKNRNPQASADSLSTPSWVRKLTKNASRTARPLIVKGTRITRKSSGPIT